jgi:hypothetical protein
MMRSEEIISFWGEENLRRSAWKDVERLPIPHEAKTFFVEVGLPKGRKLELLSNLEWEFDEEASTLPIIEGNPAWRRIGFQWPKSWHKGSGEPLPVVVDTLRDGVVLRPGAEIDDDSYTNQSVTKLAVLITLFAEFYKSAEGMPEGQSLRRLRKDTVEAMVKEDPTAFENDSCYWKQVCDDLKRGI